MTPDLRLLSGFARGVSLSLHVRVTCLHSGSWLLSGFCFWLVFMESLRRELDLASKLRKIQGRARFCISNV